MITDRKKIQYEDLTLENILIKNEHDDFEISTNPQPSEKFELKHEEKSSDASGFLERNLKEKLQMFVLLIDIHPETKELATHKLQTIGKDESVIVFFQ